MTLLELLHQELPKHGGWPEGVREISTHASGRVFFDGRFAPQGFILPKASDAWNKHEHPHSYTNAVTREQYEATSWDGKSLPPVGAECEYMKHTLNTGKNWSKGTVKYISEYTVVIDDDSLDGEFIAHPLGCNFRPIRSEADKKRDAAIEAIDWYMPECILDTPNESGHAKKIYDAIAAGKIPGVKLEV